MFPLSLGEIVCGGLLLQPPSPGEHWGFAGVLSIHHIYLVMISKHKEHHTRKSKRGSPRLSLYFLETQLNSQDKDQQQDQPRGIWEQWGWRTDLRETLCQKWSQKNEMEHCSRPAGRQQLLANIYTFDSRIIVSLLKWFFFFFFRPGCWNIYHSFFMKVMVLKEKKK